VISREARSRHNATILDTTSLTREKVYVTVDNWIRERLTA